MKYEVGDIYQEEVKSLISQDWNGNIQTHLQVINWEVVFVDVELNQIMCKNDGEYKIFKI